MPQEFRIPLKPKHSKMPKKSRIPQDSSRRTSGRNYNKMNDKNKPGGVQRVLNNVSNTSGHTLTPEGIKRPAGWLHTWGTLLMMAPPLDFPDQQMVLKKTQPAFEVNTRIDVRRDGNQTRIHSFVSTSTINHEQIQSTLFLNRPHTRSHLSSSVALPFASTADSLFDNQTLHYQTSTSTQPNVDIAKMAHELSISVHQKAHELYQLMNCSTTRRTDQVKTWVVTGESVEQTSFTTVCQNAIGRAETQNNQEMKQESESSSISTYPVNGMNVQGTSQFSAEEAAQELIKSFQDSFENKHNATIGTPNHIHNQVAETFWKGLMERLYHFFSQHENKSYTQKQEGSRNGSLMSYFVDLLLQTFSIDYGKHVPTNPPSEKNLNYQMKKLFSNQSNQTKKRLLEVTPEMVAETVLKMAPETVLEPEQEVTPEMILKTVLVLNSEGEGFLPQLWRLATDFYGVVDDFIQQSIGLQFLSAEAMPLPTTRIPSLELEENQLTFKESQISVTTTGSSQVNGTAPYINGTELEMTPAGGSNDTQEINEKIQAFLRENADDPTKVVAKEVKGEFSPPEWTSEQKENIRKNLVDFFIEKGIDCQESNAKDLMETVGEWALLEGATPPALDMVKVKQLAKIILDMEEETVISEEQAGLTVGSWIYETMKDNQPVALAMVAGTTKQSEETSTMLSPSVNEEQTNSTAKEGTVQWRNPKVRKKIEAFLKGKKVLSDQPTQEQVLIAMGKWFTQEENNHLVFNYKKLQSVAKVILNVLKLYGGIKEENVSNKDAELTVMKWVFENVLGSSIEAYIVKTLVTVPDVNQFTIGHLRDLFTVENLKKAGHLQLDVPTFSQEQKTFFNKLWNLFLQRELPNYFVDSSGLGNNLLVSDYNSLMQLTGAKILKEGEYQASFSPKEARLMGEHFWQTILEKGITTYEEFRHLLMPSLLAVAQLEPDLLREALATGTYKEVAISTFIGYQQVGYFQLVENQELLDRLYKAYQEALLQWRRKDAIATNIAEKCRNKGSRAPIYVIKQNYLLGLEEPCRDIDWFPPKLEDEYIKLTKNVSDTHIPFDKKMIEFAINTVDLKERKFIFSEGTSLYEGFAELKNETHYIGGAPGTGGMLLINFRGRVTWEDTTLSLDKTDLFVAVQGKEERWYGLKRLDEEGGYILYRVDQDPLSYLKYGLFNRKDLWEKGYRQVGNEIRIGDKNFQFSARVNRSKKLSHGVEMGPFIEALSRKHSDQLYNQLYDSGNDKADIEKAWDVIKHFIPFYDCVIGIKNQNVGEAVTSCTIDALIFIPVFGQITSLNIKFALGVARTFAKSGIRGVILNSSRFLPNIAEIQKLLLSLARTLDPGFELVIGGGRLVAKKLASLKNELWVSKKTKELLEKIETMEKSREALKKEIVMARSPRDELVIPVRKVKSHLYRRVTNLETVEVFGGLFMLKGDQLEDYRGVATFTPEQLTLIDLLEVKLDKTQLFVVEANPNPQAYGEGPITTVLKEGEEATHFIRMKEKLIPVIITVIKEHGIRLDVYVPHSEKILSVNYNGVEWYFEAETSPFISKEVETKIADILDQFETQKNPNDLSAPDSRDGLMWNESDRSYIKIKEHYIPLILLDQKLKRYHLVKKDYNEEMTVLRLDSKSGQFRFETDFERTQVEEGIDEEVLHRRGERKVKKKTSKILKEGEPSTSQGVVSQSNQSGVFPPYNKIPPSPGRGELWNKIRKAVELMEPVRRVEDPTVKLPLLAKFIPESSPAVSLNNDWINESILREINKHYRFAFRVFTGLRTKRVPEFLKPFVRKLAKDITSSMEYFGDAHVKFNTLLRQEMISETIGGEYLTKMFSLEGKDNQEEILKEIVTRLASITRKAERFLQLSKDWGFENILIVSTDLIQQGSSKIYYTIHQNLLEQAFAIRNDPECRIFVLADAFHLDPKVDLSIELTPALDETIMHEVTHITARTSDLTTYSLPMRGTWNNGKAIMDEINENFSEVLASMGFKRFVARLAEEFNLPNLSEEVVAEALALDVDPMLRTNFLLTDAELVMIIIRDVVEGRKYDDLIRVSREAVTEELGDKFMFMYLALAYELGEGIFEKDLQLNKMQKQITTRTTDNVSVDITDKETLVTASTTSGKESTRITPNRISLNPSPTKTQGSNSQTQITLNQQGAELPKTTAKKKFLDLVGTGKERSTQFKSTMIFNHPISQDQQEFSPQH
ncbi:hypothetical protein [Candidatus Enterococcus wittei]|nr:hypothetical protein [Enterococcus sp. 10A9_DIV0425]